MNSSRSTSNFADRPPSHSISTIARLTFFSSNSTANLHNCKAVAPSLNHPAPSKRNSLLTGVYNLATNSQMRIKDKYLSVNTSYFPQQENDDRRVVRKKSSSGLLNISFPSIQGDTPPALQESNYISKPPRDSPPQKQPTRIYSEDYSSISRQSLPQLERKQSFDNFTKRHYSQLSPVNIYSGGVRDLQDFKGKPLDQLDSKLQEKSLRELLKMQKRASHLEIREEKEDDQESLSIEEEEDDQNLVPMSYKKHISDIKSSRAKQLEQNERPESRQGKARKHRGNKFRITGAGFHEKASKVKKRHSLDRDSQSRFILQANLPKSLRNYERRETSPPKKKKIEASPKANEDLYAFMMNTVDECDEDPRSALQTED